MAGTLGFGPLAVKRYSKAEPPPPEACTTWEKIPTVAAAQINEPFEVETILGVMKMAAGSYVVIHTDGALEPWAESAFEAHYRRST